MFIPIGTLIGCLVLWKLFDLINYLNAPTPGRKRPPKKKFDWDTDDDP